MLFLQVVFQVEDFTVDLVCDSEGCGFSLADVAPSGSAFDLAAVPPSRWWLVGAGDNASETILQFSDWMEYVSASSRLDSVKFKAYAPRFDDQSETGRETRVFKIVKENSSDAVAYVRMRYGSELAGSATLAPGT